MLELGRMAISQVKKVYQLNEQSYQKIAKLEAKKAKIEEELNVLREDVDASEERIKHITGGYTSKDLVHPVVTPVYNADGTPKLDKTGHQVKYKKYVFTDPTENEAVDDTQSSSTPESSADITPENNAPENEAPEAVNPDALNEPTL